MNTHEIEEQEFGRSGALWDADPEVCCAAFQLGACSHTEYFDEERDLCDHVGTERVERVAHGFLSDKPAGTVEILCVGCGCEVAV